VIAARTVRNVNVNTTRNNATAKVIAARTVRNVNVNITSQIKIVKKKNQKVLK
jgi:hypothetical protein